MVKYFWDMERELSREEWKIQCGRVVSLLFAVAGVVFSLAVISRCDFFETTFTITNGDATQLFHLSVGLFRYHPSSSSGGNNSAGGYGILQGSSECQSYGGGILNGRLRVAQILGVMAPILSVIGCLVCGLDLYWFSSSSSSSSTSNSTNGGRTPTQSGGLVLAAKAMACCTAVMACCNTTILIWMMIGTWFSACLSQFLSYVAFQNNDYWYVLFAEYACRILPTKQKLKTGIIRIHYFSSISFYYTHQTNIISLDENGFGECQIARGAKSAILAVVCYLIALLGILVTARRLIRTQIQKQEERTMTEQKKRQGRLNNATTKTYTNSSNKRKIMVVSGAVKERQGDGGLLPPVMEDPEEQVDVTMDVTHDDDDDEHNELVDSSDHLASPQEDPFPCHLSDIEAEENRDNNSKECNGGTEDEVKEVDGNGVLGMLNYIFGAPASSPDSVHPTQTIESDVKIISSDVGKANTNTGSFDELTDGSITSAKTVDFVGQVTTTSAIHDTPESKKGREDTALVIEKSDDFPDHDVERNP
jgi:hypothetical protein